MWTDDMKANDKMNGLLTTQGSSMVVVAAGCQRGQNWARGWAMPMWRCSHKEYAIVHVKCQTNHEQTWDIKPQIEKTLINLS